MRRHKKAAYSFILCNLLWFIILIYSNPVSAFKPQFVKLPPKLDSSNLSGPLNIRHPNLQIKMTTSSVTSIYHSNTTDTSNSSMKLVNFGRGLFMLDLNTTLTIQHSTKKPPALRSHAKPPIVYKRYQKKSSTDNLSHHKIDTLTAKLEQELIRKGVLTAQHYQSHRRQKFKSRSTSRHYLTDLPKIHKKKQKGHRKIIQTLQRGINNLSHKNNLLKKTKRVSKNGTKLDPRATPRMNTHLTTFVSNANESLTEIKEPLTKFGRGINKYLLPHQLSQNRTPLTQEEMNDRIRMLHLKYDPIINNLTKRFGSLKNILKQQKAKLNLGRDAGSHLNSQNLAMESVDDEDDNENENEDLGGDEDGKPIKEKQPEKREWGDECTPQDTEEDDCELYTKNYPNSHSLVCDAEDKICVCRSDDNGVTAEFSKDLNICLVPAYYTCTKTQECAPLLVCAKATARDYIIDPEIPLGFPKICRPYSISTEGSGQSSINLTISCKSSYKTWIKLSNLIFIHLLFLKLNMKLDG